MLDSEMAKRDGHLTLSRCMRLSRGMRPMWPDKRLDGKGANTSTSQQRPTVTHQAISLGSKRQPRLQPQSRGRVMKLSPPGLSHYEEVDSQEVEPSHREDEGCTFPVTSKKLFLMTHIASPSGLGTASSRDEL